MNELFIFILAIAIITALFAITQALEKIPAVDKLITNIIYKIMEE